MSTRGLESQHLLFDQLSLRALCGVYIDNRIDNRPIFHNEPHQTVNQSQSQSQTQRRLQQQESKPPVIEAHPTQIEKAKVDAVSGEVANLYKSTAFDSSGLIDTDVAFAKFHRDADEFQSWVDVIGYIEFFDADNTLLFRVDKAFWWKKEGDHSTSVEFNVGDAQRMIAAIIDNSGKVFPYSGDYISAGRVGLYRMTELVVGTKDCPLEGKEFLVRITLIAGR